MQRVLAETDRFRLRLWERHEAPRLLEILGRYDVMQWLGDGEPTLMQTLAEAETRIDRYLEQTLVSPLGRWAIVPHATGVPAGTLSLLELPGGAGEVEVGWYLHPDSHGHGYATRAAELALDHGFANGLPEVYAITHLANGPSQAVAVRLGMNDLGEMVRWYEDPSRVYRITRQEWRDRSPAGPIGRGIEVIGNGRIVAAESRTCSRGSTTTTPGPGATTGGSTSPSGRTSA